MTTVIDPAGTPVPVYNRSGVTIVEITTTPGSPTPVYPIASVSGHTIALIDHPGPGGYGPPEVELPTGAEVGDLVELHVVNAGYSVAVIAPSGESLTTNANDIEGGKGSLARKISATQWALIRGK